MRTLFALLLTVLCAGVAQAQTTIDPALQRMAFDVDPGTMVNATGAIVKRPITNVAFEARVDNAATPVAVTLDGACTVLNATEFTCVARFPPLAPGSHTIEVRGKPNPAEAGVNPGGYSTPFAVVSVVVGVGTPRNVRTVTAPAPPE